MLFTTKLSTLCPSLWVLVIAAAAPSCMAGEPEFEALVSKMEADVLSLAEQISFLYQVRCSMSFDDCSRRNFEHCRSEFPGQTCSDLPDRQIPVCRDVCGALWDFDNSNVIIPGSSFFNPTDPKIIETVCYSRELDEWFRAKHEEDAPFWEEYGVEPQSMYFGSKNGVFRIYPARQTDECGSYDPRIRPWYVAGSSGPKNIMMILDTSESMKGYSMELLKAAAKRVVQTLTVSDRVAIVPFADYARVIADGHTRFIKATKENKEYLIQKIDELKAGGRTNFQHAFLQAFSIIEQSWQYEVSVNCNSAILFLTDGKYTLPNPDYVPPSVIQKEILDGLQRVQAKLDQPLLLFTYSISPENSDVHEFPRTLACAAPLGVWSPIVDADAIPDSLASYSLLFTVGLSENDDFTAWVEPYSYATGNTMGTTVSAPVYDRQRTPPLFLGVAAMDFGLQSLDIALGVKKGSEKTLERLVYLSTASCPVFDVTECELQYFRSQGGVVAGAEGDAQCDNKNVSCSEDIFAKMDEGTCYYNDDYPSNLWANLNYQDLPYEERVCCNVGEDFPSTECMLIPSGEEDDDSTTVSAGIIAGVTVAIVALCCVGGAIAVQKCRNKNKSASTKVAGTGAPPKSQEQGAGGVPDPAAPPLNIAPIPIEAPAAVSATGATFELFPAAAPAYPIMPTAPPAPPATNPNYDNYDTTSTY